MTCEYSLECTAHLIYIKFLESNAPLLIQIPPKMLASIREAIESTSDGNNDGVIDVTLFDEVEKLVRREIQAPFRRFLRSKPYKAWLRGAVIKQTPLVSEEPEQK